MAAFNSTDLPEMVSTVGDMHAGTTTNITSSTLDRDEGLAKIEIGIQATILIFAVFGNGSVLLALCKRRKKTSRMHLFIMHLSVADLLVAFCNILPQLAWDITYRFKGNDFLCRSVSYIQVMVLYLSTYILVMTAIDRYRAICHPLSNYSWTPRKVHMMIALAWTLSLVISIPQMFIFSMDTVPSTGVIDCLDHFYPEWTLRVYITCFTVSVYIVPFFILTVLYGQICYAVWKNVHGKRTNSQDYSPNGGIVYKFNGTGHISVIPTRYSLASSARDRSIIQHPRSHSLRGISRAKMKTIKLTFVVIIAYLICWSPFFITQMWWAYDSDAPINHAAFVICLLLASLNSCCNPWIYMAFSGNLLQRMVPFFRRHQKARYQNKLVINPAFHDVKPGTKSSGAPPNDHKENLHMELVGKGPFQRAGNVPSQTNSTKLSVHNSSPASNFRSRSKMHRAPNMAGPVKCTSKRHMNAHHLLYNYKLNRDLYTPVDKNEENHEDRGDERNRSEENPTSNLHRKRRIFSANCAENAVQRSPFLSEKVELVCTSI